MPIEIVEREYEYKLRRGFAVVKAIAWGAITLWMAQRAITNDRGLILLVIPLSAEDATKFYWFLTALGGLWCALEVARIARYRLVQRIRVTREGLVVPESPSSTSERTIPFSSIVSWKESRWGDGGSPQLIVRQKNASARIKLSMLPAERDYFHIVETLQHTCAPARGGS